jgi:hypothetical protein
LRFEPRGARVPVWTKRGGNAQDSSMGAYPLVEVAKRFVSKHPDVALNWIGALPADQPRGRIIGEAVLAWVQTDVADAALDSGRSDRER